MSRPRSLYVGGGRLQQSQRRCCYLPLTLPGWAVLLQMLLLR
jgi:hypothetical protein